MKYLSRVVWSEGMYLGPHHFQAQSRYFEDSVQFATSTLWFEPNGLAGYEVNAEALRNGTVSVVYARGIFADGLPFNMPECDPLPPARNIADLFPPTAESVTVHLAIPARKPDGLNCALPDSDGRDRARFIAENRLLHDESTGRDERPVSLGRKNIQLMLDAEVSGDVVTLPLARIKRDGTGHFILDDSFIPPCVQISASERLMTMLRRLIEILDEKGASLSTGRQDKGKFQAGLSQREVASFWFLHAIYSAIAPLRHLCFLKRGHPEELYVEMARLAGSLCTFGLESHPRTLPLYDHRHLSECFDALDQHIRQHLELIVPSNCISIPLTAAGQYFYQGEIKDQRCIGTSRWIFGIQAPTGEADLISKTPALVKVCSRAFVPELVKRALPGMTLTHIPVPPQAVSAKVEMQYFGISKGGPCWDHIVQTREVGIYVPGELPAPQIELLVILDS